MKTMTDNMGNQIPVKYIAPYDKTRDAAAKKLLAEWQKARKGLEDLMSRSIATVASVKEAATKTGLKGNFQFCSFDGNIKISLDQNYCIELDARVREARDKMLEYAKKLCAKAGDDAQALFEIVQEAFAANKSGSLSISRVMSLCKRNITAPEWIEAREMLLASIKPVKGRAYLSVGVRSDRQHDYKFVLLNVSDCWPEGVEVM